MPTNRTRKARTANRIEIKDYQLEILKTGLYPETPDNFEVLDFFYSDIKDEDRKLALYKLISQDLLAEWIKANPCTRPWSWYEYDAPRQKDQDVGCFWHGTLPEERLYMGGGKRCKYNYVPSYHKSIFKYWHYTDDDVPMFESEAAFLKRLNLLTDDEKRHLEKYPKLLEPESIINVIPGIKSQ